MKDSRKALSQQWTKDLSYFTYARICRLGSAGVQSGVVKVKSSVSLTLTSPLILNNTSGLGRGVLSAVYVTCTI